MEVDPHTAAFQLEQPGVIVVCTDGLWNYAESAAEMAAVVPADARTRPLAGARALVGCGARRRRPRQRNRRRAAVPGRRVTGRIPTRLALADAPAQTHRRTRGRAAGEAMA